jgi:hypothetical protein
MFLCVLLALHRILQGDHDYLIGNFFLVTFYDFWVWLRKYSAYIWHSFKIYVRSAGWTDLGSYFWGTQTNYVRIASQELFILQITDNWMSTTISYSGLGLTKLCDTWYLDYQGPDFTGFIFLNLMFLESCCQKPRVIK